MSNTILFVICIFMAVWSTIIFIGDAINGTLSTFKPSNIVIYAASITGIITHVIGIW